MMYPYIILADCIEVTHSHLLDRNNRQEVEVHFEKAIEEGFASARCCLPSYRNAA
jgi:hypothetical protein